MAGYVELAKIKKEKEHEAADTQMGAIESVQRSMRRAATSELTQLESFVSFLGTTGSTAPFIGLLGTVIGIMSHFRRLASTAVPDLKQLRRVLVSPCRDCIWSLAAIPAVIAYNYLLSRIRVLDSEMENFAADFLNIIKRHFF